MTAPSLHQHPSEEQAPFEWRRAYRIESGRDWSFTARSEPSELDSALVVYRLSLSNLGIADLARQIGARSGAAEGRRWQDERAREYVLRLRDQLRLHLTTTEFIIHATDDDSPDHLQVVVTVPSGDATETARLEQETADRVQAIAKHAWTSWSEGLRLTMATLKDLDETL